MSYAASRLTLGPLAISSLALGLYSVGLLVQVASQYAI
jgi:hypothetical protein